ncbi:7alpha-hydroxysteroid dehydrogenase [Merdimmobilis hominis]|uniref:7alpha-hydroxysteroid dehydrogenase n=1 Tax=Merdimmobilis hominis TaxID=2897707 RepID=UPI0006C7EC84|nr:SDR family oxidoreductase [Merdimmobilis hominis]
MRLQNKVVLVTASTRGIGWEIVKACAKEGAVVYMAARNLEKAEAQAKELCLEGHRVRAVFNDAYREESYATMVDEVVEKEGRVDVLVNNFGTGDPKHDFDVEHTDFEVFMGILRTNLASVYLSTQRVIPVMKKNGGGSIVNISSIGGLYPDLARIAYGISKNAINYITENLAVQGARSGIRCNAVLPGMTATEAVSGNMSPEFNAMFMKHTPIPRMGKPEEIAAAVVYFASDESAFTTGQIMAVSGGFGLPTPVYGDMVDWASRT